MYAAIDGAWFMRDGVPLAKMRDEMMESSDVGVFNTEVIYNQGELDGLRLVLEETRSMFGREVPACCEVSY